MHRPATRTLVLAACASVALAATSLAYATHVVVTLPADHFVADRPHAGFFATLGRNLGALGLLLAGAFMSLPGVPGQGILTMLIGLLLLDVPGKQAFDRRLVSRPRVLHLLNRVRARFDRPPFEVP